MIDPVSNRWTFSVPLSDKKEAENISGIACADRYGDRRHGLLIGDEKRYARLFRIEGRTIHPGGKVRLLPKEHDGTPFAETDAEGIDYEDGFYYLIGSHGVSKTDGEEQPSRFFTYRFPVDPDHGTPLFKADGDEPAAQVERSDGLRRILRETPPLSAYAERPLKDNGINIEALAVRDRTLYVGFRSPTENGTAFVLRVSVKAVFKGAASDAKVFRLELSPRSGIRDLAKVEGGFLVLTGQSLPAKPGDTEAEPAEVWFWDGTDADTVRLGRLGRVARGAKPEALLVLNETKDSYRVLVLCDGVAGGNPAEYVLPKR